MPNPRDFLIGFQLFKNTPISPTCTILKVKIKHIEVEQYKKYTFPLTIEVSSKDSEMANILESCTTFLSGHKIINSQYGNPYDCFIQDFSIAPSLTQPLFQKDVKNYVITCMGYGNRISKK